MSINKNHETFKEEFGPFKITEKTKDITKCFHPEGKTGYQGMWAMPAWLDKVRKNVQAFKPSYDSDKPSGGMIVFAEEQNIPPRLLLDCVKTYSKDCQNHIIGKGFLGQYPTVYNNNFNSNSLTLEIAGIDTQALIKLAEDLAWNLLQDCLLIKDYNNGKVYLTESHPKIVQYLNFYTLIYDNLAKAGLLDKEGYSPYMEKTSGFKFPTEFNHYVREAKQKYVLNYLHENAAHPQNEQEKKTWLENLAKTTLKAAVKEKALIFPPLALPIKSGFGYAVGCKKGTECKKDISYDIVLEFISANYDSFTDDKKIISVWYDKLNKQWNLDIAEIVFDERAAQRLSKIRKKSVYLCLNYKILKTSDGVEYGK